MKKNYVLTNTPVRFPIQSTILYSFLLHYFKADGIYWGVFITLYSIIWTLVLIMKFNEVKIDLNKDEMTPAKKRFAERLAKVMEDKKS